MLYQLSRRSTWFVGAAALVLCALAMRFVSDAEIPAKEASTDSSGGDEQANVAATAHTPRVGAKPTEATYLL